MGDVVGSMGGNFVEGNRWRDNVKVVVRSFPEICVGSLAIDSPIGAKPTKHIGSINIDMDNRASR